MQAYEYYAEILQDGHLSIPDELRDRLKPDSKVRVMILLNDEETLWNNFAIKQFMTGYSDKDAIYDSL